jgi:extradiol dioxygenase family protein
MGPSETIFHLAIPCGDLDEAWRFYVDTLGCTGTRYADRLTLDFFGAQLVCHLAPDKVPRRPEVYPRHFGMVVAGEETFEGLLDRFRRAGVTFLEGPFLRFENEDIEQLAFFLSDPSNNVIEFKCYRRPETMF